MDKIYRVSVSGQFKGEIFRRGKRWMYCATDIGTEVFPKRMTLDDVQNELALRRIMAGGFSNDLTFEVRQ